MARSNKNPNNKPKGKGGKGMPNASQGKVPQRGTPRSGAQQSTKKNANLPMGRGLYKRAT